MCNFLVSTFFFLTWSTVQICISSLVRNLFLKIFRTCNRAWLFKVLLYNKISLTGGWAEVQFNAADGQILNRCAWSELYSLSPYFKWRPLNERKLSADQLHSSIGLCYTNENKTVNRGRPEVSLRQKDLRLYTLEVKLTEQRKCFSIWNF